MKLSRRNFLKTAITGIATVVAVPTAAVKLLKGNTVTKATLKKLHGEGVNGDSLMEGKEHSLTSINTTSLSEWWEQEFDRKIYECLTGERTPNGNTANRYK